MEGISNEASSLAGHWGLGKLIALYDDNRISIDGHTEISFTEDVAARFEALGWHVQHVKDGNTDLKSIREAIEAAKAVTDKPSFIKVRGLGLAQRSAMSTFRAGASAQGLQAGTRRVRVSVASKRQAKCYCMATAAASACRPGPPGCVAMVRAAAGVMLVGRRRT